MRKNRLLTDLAGLCLLLALLPKQQAAAQTEQAWEMSDPGLVSACENMAQPKWMFDGSLKSGQKTGSNASLTLTADEGIGSLYVIFDVECGPYSLRNEETGETVTCGEENFLHAYLDLQALFGEAPRSVTLCFGENPVRINELRVFSRGEPPADVQQWKTAPEDGVDLMLFSTHGDDEQLFFAGVLPYYAGELGYEVQMAYLTRHANYGPERAHEMLDGLWAVGVTNYPVLGVVDDYYTRNLNAAKMAFEDRDIPLETIQGYVVEQLRKFKPLVVLGHDVNGEYGHGMHMLFSEMVRNAVDISADPEQFPESAETWGTWDVPKTYLHLYPEGKIHMNWDIPLEAFDGMTAYEVTKFYGFPAHKSQYDDFSWYMGPHDRAEEIPDMSPCDFGLYRTTVGPDTEGDDFFENLPTRAEQKRIQEEEARKQEEEARRQARLEAERAEAEKKAAEEKRLQEEKAAAQQAAEDKNQRIMTISVILIVVIIVGIAIIGLVFRRKNKK